MVILMDYKKQQQMKIASILFDIGLSEELVEAMTSLNKDELKQLNQ